MAEDMAIFIIEIFTYFYCLCKSFPRDDLLKYVTIRII